MFQNYIKTAFNNLLNDKIYSAINILGLAIGLMASILILLYIRYEASFDQHLSKIERLYRADTTFVFLGPDAPRFDLVSGQVQAGYLQEFPDDIEAAARFRHLESVIKLDGEGFEEELTWTDASAPQLFDFDIIQGDLVATLSNTKSIALSETFARKFFGNTNPVGQILPVEAAQLKRDYIVTAVFKDLPETSTLQVQTLALIDEEAFQEPISIIRNWGSTSVEQYILLRPGHFVDPINAATPAMLDKHAIVNGMRGSQDVDYRLVSFADFHLNWVSSDELSVMDGLWILIAVATVLISIATINFINLSTARSMRRVREVALRKVLGAKRGQLIRQFLLESSLTVALALFIALVLAELAAPFLSSILGIDLILDYSQPFWWLSFISIILSVGLLAGFYPALVVSAWRPSAVLHANKSGETKGSIRLRQALVALQFTASIALVVTTLTIYGQSKYAAQVAPGFDRENLLVVQGLRRQGIAPQMDAMMKEIQRLSGVANAAFSSETPSDESDNFTILLRSTEAGEIEIRPNEMGIGPRFFDTYAIKIIAGRAYTQADVIPPRDPDDTTPQDENRIGRVILNAKATKELGFSSPAQAIGQIVKRPEGRRLEIIGVSQDILFQSLRRENSAEAYFLAPIAADAITIRYSGNPLNTQKSVSALWKQFYPYIPLKFDFVDQMVRREFEQEERNAVLMLAFSGIAIAVATLGLFALAAFAAARRTKEISIRKIMGAKITDIVGLLLWQFSKPVLVANLLAWPISLYFLTHWLQQFPIRVGLFTIIGFCIVAGTSALLIACLTVSGNAIRVARNSPIKALRHE